MSDQFEKQSTLWFIIISAYKEAVNKKSLPLSKLCIPLVVLNHLKMASNSSTISMIPSTSHIVSSPNSPHNTPIKNTLVNNTINLNKNLSSTFNSLNYTSVADMLSELQRISNLYTIRSTDKDTINKYLSLLITKFKEKDDEIAKLEQQLSTGIATPNIMLVC